MTLRIANAAGFWGDHLDAPRRLVESAEVDYLTLEYLAELTLSILAHARDKDPRAGYATDFLTVLESLAPALRGQPRLRIVTNAGGMNAAACARAASRILARAGLEDAAVGVVTGDDILARLDEIQDAGCDLANLETGEPLRLLAEPVVSANVYLGARPIAEALAAGGRIVITGRVADASLALGPAVHEFGWKWDDWRRLACGSIAGHLIECGAQVTGGYATRWQDRDLADIGYPIAELEADGGVVITKPAGSGGVVDRPTVVEQLVYEIGDPRHYLTPDVEVDFSHVEVRQAGPDRVAVSGGRGSPPPDSYKVSLAHRAGYAASGQLLVHGPDCVAKARACGEMVFARLARAGYMLAATNVELLGTGDGVPGVTIGGAVRTSPPEVVLRIAVEDPRREAVERFTTEFAPLITSGPAGLAGYAAPRGAVRPVYAFWPALVPRRLAASSVEVRTAGDWLGDPE